MDENSETNQQTSADGEAEAGRPRGSDELDPELVSLARRRGTAGPLLSISIIVFCVYLMVRLAADFRFSRQGDTPRKIQDLAEIVSGDGAGPEEFVALRATPDHSFVVRLAGTGSRYGHRVAPIAGSDAKLWLLEEATPWAAKPSYSHAYAGRLRRLDDMPFEEALRSHVSSRPAAPRFVTPAEAKESLSAKSGEITNPFGDTLTVEPTTTVAIAVTVLDRVRIEAFRNSLPEEADCLDALVAAGILSGDARPTASSKEMFVYEIAAPEGLAAVREKLRVAKLFSARAEPVVQQHETTWGHMSATDSELRLNPSTAVPWAHVSSISVLARRELPADAMVLLTNERPGGYWYVLPLLVLLGLFVILFVWALIQYFRRDAGADEPVPAETPSS